MGEKLEEIRSASTYLQHMQSQMILTPKTVETAKTVLRAMEREYYYDSNLPELVSSALYMSSMLNQPTITAQKIGHIMNVPVHTVKSRYFDLCRVLGRKKEKI